MIADRLAQLDAITLRHGTHDSPEDGMCAMEAVAWLAGESHSDGPECACPVIRKAVIRLNDRMRSDELRTELLRPLLPKIIGSRVGCEGMAKRGFIAADMAVRVFAPMALEARGKLDLAKSLRGCAPIVDRETAEAGRAAAAAAADSAFDVAFAAAAAAAADSAFAADYAAAAADYAVDVAVAAAAFAAADAAFAADYAKRKVFEECVRMIERMLEVRE